MVAPLTKSVKTFLGIASPFSLESLPDFPYSDWMAQQEKYAELEKWYSGAALDEKIQDKNGNVIDKFPLHLNPIPNTCEKHASVLLGTTLESIRHGGVPITFIPESKPRIRKPKPAEAFMPKKPPMPVMPGQMPKPEEPSAMEKQMAEDKAEQDAEQIEADNNAQLINNALTNAFLGGGGGSLFVTNGVDSQYLGGSVWGVCYTGNDEDEFPVQVMSPHPTEFIAFPDGNNFWKLREAWFVREISWMDAEAYGYPVPEMVRNPQQPTDPKSNGYRYYYIEHWKKDAYSISVNEMPIQIEGVTLAGPNPYEVVPFVYIPHKRGKKFIGEGIINEAVKGIVKEMNARTADIGDAVQSDSHGTLAVRGVRGTIKTVKLPDGRPAADLGSAAGLGSNETQPDLFAVRTQSMAAPQLDYVDKLEQLYRVEVKHPAVADGLDEGSQRSSLTLTTRMWPLQSHVELERINWTTGLLMLAKLILTVCATKGAYEITEEHLDSNLTIKWSSMLPRDREQLVNEVAMRKTNDLISTPHAVSLFGDVDNVEEEVALIDEDSEKATEKAMRLKPPPVPGGQGAADTQKKEQE